MKLKSYQFPRLSSHFGVLSILLIISFYASMICAQQQPDIVIAKNQPEKPSAEVDKLFVAKPTTEELSASEMSAAGLEKTPQEDKLTKAGKLTNEQKKDLEHNVANRVFVPPVGVMPTGESSLSTEPKYAYTTDVQQQPDSAIKNQPEKSMRDIDKFLGNTSDFESVVGAYEQAKTRATKESLSSPLDNIFKAYKAGKMSAQEKQEFEQDVNAGILIYPAHIRRTIGVPTKTTPTFLDQGIINAYNSGVMTPQERQELEQDLKNKVVTLPPGVSLTAPQPEPSLLDKAKDLFTGDLRKTQESQVLPDWESMPEMNDLSWAGAKTGLGTFMSSPEESMQIIKTNYPNVEIKQDSKGNYLVKSSIDGKWYSSKPGLIAAYALRVGTTVAATVAALPATTSLLGVVGLGTATQAGIEGLQSSVGGTFNLGYVIVLSIMSVILFVLLQADANKIKALIQDTLSKVRSIRQTMQARKAAALMTSNHTGKISRQKTKASINIRFAFSFDALLSSKLLLTILLCTIIVILVNA